MSARQTWLIVCDAPGCGRDYSANDHAVHKTRELAARVGWAYRVIRHIPGPGRSKGEDLCPEHAEPTVTIPIPVIV